MTALCYCDHENDGAGHMHICFLSLPCGLNAVDQKFLALACRQFDLLREWTSETAISRLGEQTRGDDRVQKNESCGGLHGLRFYAGQMLVA